MATQHPSPSPIFINPHSLPTLPKLPPPSTPHPQILTFHRTLPSYAPTPLIPLPTLASSLGLRGLFIKNESSRFGLPAFKILGASWAVYRALLKWLNLDLEFLCNEGDLISLEILGRLVGDRGGVKLYAATDGNHGRAVARMAKILGLKARIYVPNITPFSEKELIRGEGSEIEIVDVDGDYDLAVLRAKKESDEDERGGGEGGGLLISDTPLVFGEEVGGWIVEGYGSLFGEIEEQLGGLGLGVTHLFTPVGSGSLCEAGIRFYKSLSPSHSHDQGKKQGKQAPKIITVEPTNAATAKTSLEKNEATTIKTGYSICTGCCCGTLSANAWPVLREGVDVAVEVGDERVDAAVRELRGVGVRVGPCGGLGLAGLRMVLESDGERGIGLGRDSVVVLLCTEGEREYELRD